MINPKNPYKILFEIHIPKNYACIYLGEISKHPKEKEVLFTTPKYKIDKMYMSSDGVICIKALLEGKHYDF